MSLADFCALRRVLPAIIMSLSYSCFVLFWFCFCFRLYPFFFFVFLSVFFSFLLSSRVSLSLPLLPVVSLISCFCSFIFFPFAFVSLSPSFSNHYHLLSPHSPSSSTFIYPLIPSSPPFSSYSSLSFRFLFPTIIISCHSSSSPPFPSYSSLSFRFFLYHYLSLLIPSSPPFLSYSSFSFRFSFTAFLLFFRLQMIELRAQTVLRRGCDFFLIWTVDSLPCLPDLFSEFAGYLVYVFSYFLFSIFLKWGGGGRCSYFYLLSVFIFFRVW